MLDDKELAHKLQIDTSRPGDVYLIRETNTPYNSKPANVEISGFEFTSEKFLTKE